MEITVIVNGKKLVDFILYLNHVLKMEIVDSIKKSEIIIFGVLFIEII